MPEKKENPMGAKTPRTTNVTGVGQVIVRTIADRPEHEACEVGTPGCCIDHTADSGSCETW